MVTDGVVTHDRGWTAKEAARAEQMQQEGALLYRMLRAALRREPSPRELHRARAAWFEKWEQAHK